MKTNLRNYFDKIWGDICKEVDVFMFVCSSGQRPWVWLYVNDEILTFRTIILVENDSAVACNLLMLRLLLNTKRVV